jgi:hypothetical protein
MPQCTAKSSRTGKRCGKQAIKGATVCRTHGASAPQVKAAADRRVQAEQAREAVQHLGLTAGLGRIDPRDALELELWRTHVNVQMYEALVADLPLAEGGIYGHTFHASGEPTGEAKPHVLVVMRDTERTRLAQVAVAAAKAGVEERRVKLAEHQAELIAQYTRALLTELGIDPASDVARDAIRRQLTVIHGGVAA